MAATAEDGIIRTTGCVSLLSINQWSVAHVLPTPSNPTIAAGVSHLRWTLPPRIQCLMNRIAFDLLIFSTPSRVLSESSLRFLWRVPNFVELIVRARPYCFKSPSTKIVGRVATFRLPNLIWIEGRKPLRQLLLKTLSRPNQERMHTMQQAVPIRHLPNR